MMISRLGYAACSLSLWLGIHIVTALTGPVHAQIEPPPSSGTPGSTTGGGSRS